MLGTISELDSYYVGGEGLGGRTLSIYQLSWSTDSTIGDIFDMYGFSDFEEATMKLMNKLAHHDLEAGGSPWSQNSGAENTENDPNVLNLKKMKEALLLGSLDANALPLMDQSWGDKLINVADDGDFYRGKLVYLAIRLGLITRKMPFPSHIAAIVIAASAESLKGSWTLRNLSSVMTVKREDGTAASTENVMGSWKRKILSFVLPVVKNDDDPWDDSHRVYVVLPRSCILGPGMTGRVACRAYGVGWVRNGKLENYEDILLEDNQVLASEADKPRSGIVASLLCATIFMIDKGHQLGLLGWSGVLSVLAQYRVDRTYASVGATASVVAVRSGQAKYASDRDLTGSSVPTFWFPLLALAAEISGSNAAWGASICAVICVILLHAHALKLFSYGFSGIFAALRVYSMACLAGLHPLTYRLTFYTACTSMIFLCLWLFVKATGCRITRMSLIAICFSIGNIVEFVLTAILYSWDPNPSSTWLRARWIIAWSNVVAWVYIIAENNSVESVAKEDEHIPYTLSGWSHRQNDSNKASRYIVEYGSGSEVSEESPHLEHFYTKWSG